MEVTSRNHTVDIFRLLASFFIVFLHVGFNHMNENLIAIIRISGRWGVPFFFLLSGYFFQKSLVKSPLKALSRNCSKIFYILIVADIIYIIALYSLDGHFNWKHIPLGAHFHLWFLPSLIMGTVTLFLINKFKVKFQLSLTLSLLIISLVLFTDSYSSIFHLGTERFSGYVIPLLSIPYMIIGSFFSERFWFKKVIKKEIGFTMLIIGFIMQIIEVKVINFFTSRSMVEHQYLIGTLFLSLGIFILAFSLNFKSERLGKWGKEFSLFIYLYHPLIILLLYHTNHELIFSGNTVILFPIFVFLITLILAILIYKYLNRLFLLLTGSLKEAVYSK